MTDLRCVCASSLCVRVTSGRLADAFDRYIHCDPNVSPVEALSDADFVLVYSAAAHARRLDNGRGFAFKFFAPVVKEWRPHLVGPTITKQKWKGLQFPFATLDGFSGVSFGVCLAAFHEVVERLQVRAYREWAAVHPSYSAHFCDPFRSPLLLHKSPTAQVPIPHADLCRAAAPPQSISREDDVQRRSWGPTASPSPVAPILDHILDHAATTQRGWWGRAVSSQLSSSGRPRPSEGRRRPRE